MIHTRELLVSQCLGYSVEVFEEGFSVWDKLTSCSAGLSYTAKELRNGKTYKFRVRAENIYGASPPTETDTVLAKNPYGEYDVQHCYQLQ